MTITLGTTGDWRMAELPLGLQLRNTKFRCFPCECGSRARHSLFKGTVVTPTSTDSGTNKRHPHQSFSRAEAAEWRVLKRRPLVSSETGGYETVIRFLKDTIPTNQLHRKLRTRYLETSFIGNCTHKNL
jgi:hypothetical protein